MEWIFKKNLIWYRMNFKPHLTSAKFSRMDESVFLNALKETFQHMGGKLNYFCLSIRIVRAHTKDIVLQNRCVTWNSYSGVFYIQGNKHQK